MLVLAAAAAGLLLAATVCTASPFDPHPLPPNSSPSPFFEGWFTRVVAPEHNLSVSVIVGDYRPAKGAAVTELWACLLLDVGGRVTTKEAFLAPEGLRLTVSGGRNVTQPPKLGTPADFRWQHGNSSLVVRDNVSTLDFSFCEGGSGFRVRAELSERVPWDKSAPDSSGPEGWLEAADFVLPTHYYVQTLASHAAFRIDPCGASDSQAAVQGRGFAHQEANWGGTFPSAWIWAQGIAPDGEVQLVLTAGEFDIAGITTKQSIIALRTPTLSATFRNIDLVSTQAIRPLLVAFGLDF